MESRRRWRKRLAAPASDAPAMTTYPTKITFGEMPESGACDVLIYCRDYRCGHHTEANADGWASGRLNFLYC